MKRGVLSGLIGLIALIGVVVYLFEKNEEAVPLPKAETERVRKALESGRQPGDQRVRKRRTETQSEVGQRGGPPRSEERIAQSGQQGRSRPLQPQARPSDRFRDGSEAVLGVISKDSIPVFVDGVQKGEITGQELLDRLDEVAVISGQMARKGWVVPEALSLVGIKRAEKVVFIDRWGGSTPVQWSQLEGEEPLLILYYNQGGQLSLFSGQRLDPQKGGKRRTNRKMREQARGTGSIAVIDIVKIEVPTG